MNDRKNDVSGSVSAVLRTPRGEVSGSCFWLMLWLFWLRKLAMLADGDEIAESVGDRRPAFSLVEECVVGCSIWLAGRSSGARNFRSSIHRKNCRPNQTSSANRAVR